MGKPKLGNIFAGRNVNPGRRDVDHLWAPCSSSPDDDEYCGDVDTNPVTGYALTDEIVMDEVVRTVEEGVMARGKLRRPRLTFVNLPQVDSAGHAGGRESPLYTQAIGLADGEIERLVTTLKAEGIWDRSVLVTLSDHSMDTTLNKVSMVSAFDDAGIPANAYLAVDGDNGSAEHVYVSNRLSPERHALLKQMRDAALATDGVGGAYYRRPNPLDGGRQHTLGRQQRSWHLGGRRTGDLFLTADPGSGFADPNLGSNPVPGNHGAPQTADNFMAVSGGGPLVHQGIVAGDGRRRNPVNVDVAPTVMALLGLREPADSRGRVMRTAFDRGELRDLAP
jgi:arylsulfatase A-like enzyme